MNRILKLIGPRDFYKKILIIAVPLIIQQLLLNTFSIIDTIMVGSIYRGVAGVGIASQISSIIFTVIYGINTGASIFIAQFFGARDEHNLKNSFALGLFFVIIFASITSIIVFCFPNAILGIFSDDPEVIRIATSYCRIAVISFIPNAISFAFSFAYRNIQKTKVPLVISIISACLNVAFNYLLIYGIWIFPKLGVDGAAVATVISTVVGMVIHLIYGYKTKQIFFPTLMNLKSAFKKSFLKKVSKKTLPLIINELIFSIGTALYIVFINDIGSDAYEGYRIAETVVSIMFTITFGLSTSVGAMIGESLGRKDIEEAKNYGNWFLSLGILVAICIGLFNILMAPLLVSLFNNPIQAVIWNAVRVLRAFSIRIVFRVFIVILFAIFRAGGESRFVMILDAGILWVVGIPIALFTSKILHINDVSLFFIIIQIESLVRLFVGFIHYNKHKWLNNMTSIDDEIILNKKQKEAVSL